MRSLWKRVGVLLGILLISSAATSGAVAEDQAEGFDVTPFIEAAMGSVVDGSIRLSSTETFVTVVQEGKSRYAIINTQAPDAPEGRPEIDGNVFARLGLDRIMYVGKQVVTEPPAQALPKPAEKEQKRDVSTNTNYLYWWTEWYYDGTWYSDIFYHPTGTDQWGCANNTDHDQVMSCTLAHSSSFTTTANSNLSYEKLVTIGFTRGETKSVQETFTIRNVPPRTIMRLRPMAERHDEAWYERSDRMRCETPYWWSWWCSTTPVIVDTSTANGLGRKALTVFVELSAQPYNQ